MDYQAREPPMMTGVHESNRTVLNTGYLQLSETSNRHMLSAAIFSMGLMGPLALFGNVMVIVVYWFRFKESATRCFVLTVAFYDLLTTAISLPTELYSMLEHATFVHPILCKVYVFVEQFSSSASTTTLVIFALHRYRKICLPLERQMSMHLVRSLQSCVFIFAIGLTWPALILYGNRTVVTPYAMVNGTTCGIQDYFRNSTLVTVYRLSLLLMFSVGAISLLVLYVLIGRKVLLLRRCKCNHGLPYQKIMREMMTTVKLRATSQTSNNSTWRSARISASSLRMTTNQSKASITHKRTTLLIAVTTMLVFVSFLPNLIVRVLEEYSPDYVNNFQPGMLIFYHFLIRLYYLHCAVNPIMYSVFSSKFREELKKLSPRRNNKQRIHKLVSSRKRRWIIE